MSYYFVMVGHEDNPIFEMEYSRTHHMGTLDKQNPLPKKEDQLHLHQFTAHASLDIIDEVKWVSNNLNFKALDRFNEYIISAFVTPSQIRFVMLHLERNDDAIKNFFHDVFDLYTKLSLNPFYSPGTKIHFQSFLQRVNSLCIGFPSLTLRYLNLLRNSSNGLYAPSSTLSPPLSSILVLPCSILVLWNDTTSPSL